MILVSRCMNWCALALFCALAASSHAQLRVVMRASGLGTISYNGVVLEDTARYPSDAFHIWHTKLTDLQGNVVSGPNYGWGENNLGKTWNQATSTWLYRFSWGTVSVRFVQNEDALDLQVTETNLATSRVILDGATIYPLALHFPQLPKGFVDATYPQLAFNTTGPSVTLADFGSGEVAAVVPGAEKPLYSGFLPAGSINTYTAIISSTTPDRLATFLPHNDRPVLPGQTDRFTVSLRFTSAGIAAADLATDAYDRWAQRWPAQLHWSDRRPIGTAYLASSPSSGDVSQAARFPNNPRRFFNVANAGDFDVHTAVGLAAFQKRVLDQAKANVQNMRKLGAQGAITWDIEGEEFPQSTSYVCEPDNIAQIAPEMETLVGGNSAYRGMKLDDAYFKTMTDAHFRVGVCIRPQHFTLNNDGTAQQSPLADALIAAELIRKARFAHDRWGATLFYVDSSVEPNGAVLDAAIFQQVAASFPDSLFIPEETTAKYYAYTAPFLSYIFHESLGTEGSVHSYYPHAFSAILVNDADRAKLAKDTAALIASVKAGDLLMAHVDYWQANNASVVAIYAAARGSTTARLPPRRKPLSPINNHPELALHQQGSVPKHQS